MNEARKVWAGRRAQAKHQLLQEAMQLDRSISIDTVALTSAALAVRDGEKKKALARMQAEEDRAARVRNSWRY